MAYLKPYRRMPYTIEELAKSSRNASFENRTPANLTTDFYFPCERELHVDTTDHQRKRKRSNDSECPSTSPYESPRQDSLGSNSDHSDEDRDHSSKKKPRTTYTNFQMYELERYYLKNRYLQIEDRPVLAKKLSLTQTQIKWWFQNRRMKEKRQIKSSGVADLSGFVGVGKRPPVNINDEQESSLYQQLPWLPENYPMGHFWPSVAYPSNSNMFL